MARGDAIVGLLTASGVFQPAAGVEVMITVLTTRDTGDIWNVYDGVNTGAVLIAGANGVLTTRLPISNSVYIQFTAGTTPRGTYHGIQTK